MNFLPNRFFNFPVGPEEIIHHLQGCHLSGPCQLILDLLHYHGFHGGDNLFLYHPVYDDVPTEQRLIFPKSLHP